uniref:Uncharacterized protein n=1 Tax=Caenorhabditis japonica TaxID=281687 RepID=A0A8R1EP96_CAEJA
MVGVTFNSVPSPSTCRNISLATLHLARSHIQTQLSQFLDEGQSFCLVSDETTKGTKKAQTYGVHSSDGTFICLGLEQVAEKSAQTAFATLEAAVSKLPRAPSDFFKKFMVNVRSTMSDSARTEIKFNKIVENYRSLVAPEVVENFTKLSDQEKSELLNFSNFFCQLHLVSNFTHIVLKSLLELEMAMAGVSRQEEPSVLTLIKSVSQYFGQRGSGLHQILTIWDPWCKQKNIARYSFPSFVGNRFNIVFVLASRVFHHRQDLIVFCEEFEHEKTVLTKVLELLKNPLITAHLQVLGFCDQLITGPLWRLAENSEHILSTCQYSLQLINWLEDCTHFPLSFFDGVSPVTNLQVISPTVSGLLLRSLVDMTPSAAGIEAATLVSKSSLIYFKKVFVDFLPGGKHNIEADEIREETRGAPATNRASESVFGFMTHLCDTKPNLRFEQVVLQQTRQKNQIAAQRRAKKASDQKRFTADIVRFGFWESKEEVEAGLLRLNTDKSKKEGIIAQLRFRDKVLNQSVDRQLFKISSGQRQFDVSQLQRKLLVLLELDEQPGRLLLSANNQLVGKLFVQKTSSTSPSSSSAPQNRCGFIEDVFANRRGCEFVTLRYDDDDTSFRMPRVDFDNSVSSKNIIVF